MEANQSFCPPVDPIADAAAKLEPPKAWRASTLRAIAEWFDEYFAVVAWLGPGGEQPFEWAAFLSQEADRLEATDGTP